MKRVLYLHGLESKQGGEKVEFLANECIVHAPEMDYTRKDVFSFLTKKIEDFQPDFIIGSSMGAGTPAARGGQLAVRQERVSIVLGGLVVRQEEDCP